jgi:hypothetical protein
MSEIRGKRATNRPHADLQQSVGAWLSGQGFPLELRVARILESLDMRVLPNRYVDVPEFRRPREIDALAMIQQDMPLIRAQFELYVECKWSRDNPWVVFVSGGPPPPISATLQAVPTNAMGEALLWLLQDSAELARFVPFGASGVLAHGGRRTLGNPKGKQADRFYAAMQSVSSIARAGVRAGGAHTVATNPDRDPAFAFPVVVVDGPLFSATLAEDSDGLELTPIQRARVLWRGLRGGLSCIDVVQASALEAFARECVQGLKGAFEQLMVVHSEVAQALRVDSPERMSHWFRGRTITPPIKVPALLRALATKHVLAQEARLQT